ncbi:hypothetical protein [Planomicrobium sp. YIM 101495]|uniref:hypothetical protein n=1 Tax=Planomicrobium sp. YIM 101495 TaxID=2665160 RepID=UPI0012B8996E|nr:hypothetical protein [Planomicrobium sp. YIM 101495]MTD31871.1 hypothetical protein [Planomicrobium sp. YIM 101495]
MKMYVTVLLRCLVYVALAFMVYDYLKVDQQFTLFERGYIDNFEVTISNGPGLIFIALTAVLVLLNLIQLFRARKNKQIKTEDILLPEYDHRDERAVEITGRAVRFAFAFILLYSFLVLGSYMMVPNYFLDYIWYPMLVTASIPVAGLLVYLLTFKVLEAR